MTNQRSAEVQPTPRQRYYEWVESLNESTTLNLTPYGKETIVNAIENFVARGVAEARAQAANGVRLPDMETSGGKTLEIKAWEPSGCPHCQSECVYEGGIGYVCIRCKRTFKNQVCLTAPHPAGAPSGLREAIEYELAIKILDLSDEHNRNGWDRPVDLVCGLLRQAQSKPVKAIVEKLRHAAASGYGDMELVEIADSLDALFTPQREWHARWYGSPPMKGAHLWDGSNIIAHIGETEAHLDIAREIAAAHNSCLAAPVESNTGEGVMGEIGSERQRQKDKEGWTTAHDDAHRNGELAAAAACYAFMASKDDTTRNIVAISESNPQYADPEKRLIAVRFWPWEWSWFKLKDRRRDLIRAGALIVAEIERLDRAALNAPQGKEGE